MGVPMRYQTETELEKETRENVECRQIHFFVLLCLVASSHYKVSALRRKLHYGERITRSGGGGGGGWRGGRRRGGGPRRGRVVAIPHTALGLSTCSRRC